MAITVRDLARAAGVSAMTVSRVLNGQSGVAAATRAKVEAAVAELNFAPEKPVPPGGPARTHVIGMIVPDVSNPFFGPIVRGAETAARKAGSRLLLCNSESELRLERDYVADLVAHRVDGLVIAPVSDRSKAHLERLVAADFPIVLIDRYVAGLDCDRVGLDNVDGARQLTEHLLSVGHRRIALVTDDDEVSTGRDRLEGYRQALIAAGVGFSDGLVFRTSTDQLGGYRATQQVLAAPVQPTAILAVNNMTAVGAMRALRQARLSVPEDMALVCFDDIEHLAVIAPFLTVLEQPAETMARVAAELLLERISGNAGRLPRSITFPGQLIVRRSSGSRQGA